MRSFDIGGFSPTYRCTVDPEFPGSGEWSCPVVAYSRDGEMVDDFRSRWGAPLIVRVEPAQGAAWVGYFEAGGLGGIDGVFACPSPSDLCVVAEGQPYVIDVRDPSSCWRPRTSPVMQIEPAAEAEVLLLADFTDMAAIGADGVRWESGRLCLDGLKIEEVSGKEIHCQGDYLEVSEGFVIDALTGRLISGRQFIDPFG